MSELKSDRVRIALAEFDALRDEINSRTTLAYGLIALELAALGAGASIVNKFPDALVGLAGISSFLWLFWVDHAGQVYKMASYIGWTLAKQLEDVVEVPVLQWEGFVRALEENKQVYIQRATSADWYTALLFGLTPPGLTIAYIATVKHLSQHISNREWIEIGLVLALWILAVWRFIGFKRTIANVGRIIPRPALAAIAPSSSDGTSAEPAPLRGSN